MRIMVTGGRYYGMLRAAKPNSLAWAERDYLVATLGGIHSRTPIMELTHGECPYGGADLLADMWARSVGVPVDPTPVSFQDGPWPAAGPKRNGRALRKLPDYLVAFDGNAGTADCVRQAKAMGIEVMDLRS